MSITIHTIDFDNVINSVVLTGNTTYEYAISNIFPLINRFGAQRKIQNPSFYDRLRRDILKGCTMPPITLALIENNNCDLKNNAAAEKYLASHINQGYVLDGMQRLNTLNAVKDEEGFNKERNLYVTIIISSNKDMLLYRMITLNNGQRPMSPRHQIEVLTEELFDFTGLDISVQTEKERGEQIIRGSFNLSDISKGYLAFFTNNLHNENNKIIAEKMDEIIVNKIMESAPENTIEFQRVLELIDILADNEGSKSWLKVQNNLIGFCVGIKHSYSELSKISSEEFGNLIEKFESAFRSINAAKVNLGRYRRELSCKYIANINNFKDQDVSAIIEYFANETAS